MDYKTIAESKSQQSFYDYLMETLVQTGKQDVDERYEKFKKAMEINDKYSKFCIN